MAIAPIPLGTTRRKRRGTGIGPLGEFTEEERSWLGRLGSKIFSGWMLLANTADTPQQILRSTIMWLQTQDPDRFDDIFKAMIPFKRKFGVGEEELPDWEDVLEEYGMEESWQRTGLSLAIGITGDLLLLPNIAQLSARGHALLKAGKVGVKAGKVATRTAFLAETWGAQAALGQRLLFQWPFLSKLAGQQIAVTGKRAVGGIGVAGRYVSDTLGGLVGTSRARTAAMKGMTAAERVVDVATQQASERLGLAMEQASLLRPAMNVVAGGTAEESLKSKSFAEMAGGAALHLRPYSDGKYFGGLAYGMTRALDNFADAQIGILTSIIEAGKDLSPETARLFEPMIEMVGRAVQKAVKEGTPQALEGIVLGKYGKLIGKKVSELLDVPILTAKKAAAMNLSGKTLLYVDNIVGPQHLSKQVTALEKAGAEVLQAGLVFAKETPEEIILSAPQYLASRVELALHRQLYAMANNIEEIVSLATPVGEDFIRTTMALAEDLPKVKRIFSLPPEELTPIETIVKYMQRSNAESFATDKKYGAPIADLVDSTSTQLAYMMRQLTPEGLPWLGTMMKDPKRSSKILGELAGMNGVKLSEVWKTARVSKDMMKYTPWEKAPKHIRDALSFMIDNEEILTTVKGQGIPPEAMSWFGTQMGWHYSMIARNPIFGDMSILQLNEFFTSHGAPKMFIDNPFTIMIMREARTRKFAVVAESMMDLAKEVGEPVYGKSIQEIAKGIVPRIDDLEQAVRVAGFDSIDDAVEAVRLGKKVPGKTQKMLQAVKGRNASDLRNISKTATRDMGFGQFGVVPEGQGTVAALNDMLARQGKGAVRFPAEIAEGMTRQWAFMQDPYKMSKLYRGYMSVLRWWKGWQLFPWPAYHVRNVLSDFYRATVWAGMSPFDALDNFKMSQKLFAGEVFDIKMFDGTLVKSTTVRAELLATIGKSQGMTGGAMEDLLSMATDPFKKGGYFDNIRQTWRSGHHLRGKVANVSQFITDPVKNPIGYLMYEKIAKPWELHIRGAVAIDQIRKGSEAGPAAKHALKWLIDYADMSLWEKKYAKALIPFYSWQRHNIPLVIESVFAQPYVYDVIARASKAANDQWGTDMELAVMPEYIKRQVFLRWPTAERDIPAFLVASGFPEQDVFELISFSQGLKTPITHVLSMFTPLLKTPIEWSTDKNFYFDAPISEFTRGYSYLRIMPEPVKRFLGFHEYTDKKGNKRYIMNPWALSLMQHFRVFSELGRVTDERKDALAKMINVLTGFKVSQFDVAYQARLRLREERERVLKDAELRGLVKRYTVYGKPKWVATGDLPSVVSEALERYR